MPVVEFPPIQSRTLFRRTAAVAPRVLPESESMAHSRLVRRELTVELENGLHMVPCSAIAKAVQEFGGPVRIFRGDLVIDASSVFDLLGLGAQRGTVLVLEADGEAADGVLDQIEQVFLKEPAGRR